LGNGLDSRPPEAACLFRGLARRGLPSGQPSLLPLTAPSCDTPVRDPGNDDVNSDLRHQLDGQLPPVTFGERLHDRQAWLRLWLLPATSHLGGQHRLVDGRHRCLGSQATSVGQEHPLAGSQPTYCCRVMTLGAIDDELVVVAQRWPINAKDR
jgi:hypothetical protein